MTFPAILTVLWSSVVPLVEGQDSAPLCLKDGLSYTYKVVDKDFGDKPFEMTFTVTRELRQDRPYFRVDSYCKQDKLETTASSVFQADDLKPVRFVLTQKGRRGKEKLDRTHEIQFTDKKYQYLKDGENFGSPRDLKHITIFPEHGSFFFLTLLTKIQPFPLNASLVDLETCRISPINFIEQEEAELDAGPLKKVKAGIVVTKTAETEIWNYCRSEDGLMIRSWPHDKGEVELKNIDDLLEKVRGAWQKGENYLEQGDKRKAIAQFKKVAKAKGDFLLIRKAQARVAELEGK